MLKRASTSKKKKSVEKMAKSTSKHTSLVSHPIFAVGYVLIAYLLPVFNAVLTIAMPIIWHIPTTLSDSLLLVIYFISLYLLKSMNKSLGLKKVNAKDNIISKRGFVKTFPIYAIAVVSIAQSSNPLSLAIGAAGLVLYYQYITEYVSKMF